MDGDTNGYWNPGLANTGLTEPGWGYLLIQGHQFRRRYLQGRV